MLGKITVDVGIAVATTASEFSNANKVFGKSDDVIKITDDLPVGANKIDDVVKGGSGSVSRPTWRQSELDAVNDFPNYSTQKSFIDGNEVPYGTKGSVRPDFYTNGTSIDIKNYNVTTSSGRSNLASNIEKQYLQRLENLPTVTKQSVVIDIRGQNVSDQVLESLYNNIMKRTNNGVDIMFKTK